MTLKRNSRDLTVQTVSEEIAPDRLNPHPKSGHSGLLRKGRMNYGKRPERTFYFGRFEWIPPTTSKQSHLAMLFLCSA